ncbi:MULTISPECIES: DUF927 domain-containing protein [Pirellulaceae]|nr:MULTISPECIES: DUF927 domain-containing protein [Pirellulaceae]
MDTPNAVALELIVNGKRRSHQLSDLADTATREELNQQVRRSTSIVKVNLRNLPSWPDEYRPSVLTFLAENENHIQFCFGRRELASSVLLGAILEIPANERQLKLLNAIQAAAIEVAAIQYPNSSEVAANHIAQYLKNLGIKGVRVSQLNASINKSRKHVSSSIRKSTTGDHLPIADIFSDVPVEEDLRIPPGWVVTADGISQIDEPIEIDSPVFIKERHVDKVSEKESVTLAFLRDDAWKFVTVSREIISSNRLIVDTLASIGFPVNSNNAPLVVQYLADFEKTNLRAIRRSRITLQLGWQGDHGHDGFMLGTKHLVSKASQGSITNIQFQGADQGNQQIASAFYSTGSFETWRNVLESVREKPQVMLAVYSSLSAPMLSILGAPNFLMSIAAPTSSGKTVALRVAASVWGNPNEQQHMSVLKTWSSTATWRERVPAVLHNLPFMMDDTKLALKASDVGTTIYQVAQGIGKGRGSVLGIAHQDVWNTVAITSGEQPLTNFTQDGGTRARTLSCWGSPFSNQTPETGRFVRQVDSGVRENFGHAGQRFIQYLLDHQQDIKEWQVRFSNELGKFEAMATPSRNIFAGRMATHFATISTTAWLAHKALQLPWEYRDPIEPLWDMLVEEAGEANRAAEALRYVMDWAWSNQASFFGRTGMTNGQPTLGWAGRWDVNSDIPDLSENESSWECIVFIRARLRALLSDGGFEAEAIIRTWRDSGWLLTDDPKRMTRKVRIGAESNQFNAIAIRRTAIEEVTN